MIVRLAAMLLLLAEPAFGQALPVFSDTGPDAAAFGADAGYPTGTRATMGQQRNLVGAFSHYDELLPARRIPRAAAPSRFDRAPQELVLHYTHQGVAHTLGDYLDRHPATGLLIVRDHTILYEHYRYGRTDRDRLTSQSMAKTVLAMLIGIAIDEGSIRSIDDAASVYVPDLAGTELGRTPLRALLQMASGLAFTEVYDGHDDQAKMMRGLSARDSPGAAAVLRQFDTRVAEPDTLWHYAGVNSELLGLVLTNATHMHPADYLASRVWSRIGTEADAVWITDATGQEVTSCCLDATLRDWARFGLLLANDGAWDGHQIVPRQWVLDATTAAPRGALLAPRTATPFYGYGYQVWTLPRPRRQFAMLGIHGQVIFVLPAAKLVLVHTAVRPKPSGDPMANELISLWTALVSQEGH